MCNQNEWIVRAAFLAYDRGDVGQMLAFVHPDLEWTYPDPGSRGQQLRIRRGREELEKMLIRQSEAGLRAHIEEVVASGDQVILVTRTPGLAAYRNGSAGDLTYDVVTVRDGLIVGLHGCRDRDQARSLAGIS